MIDALNSGRLYGTPQQRTTKTDKPFATGKLRCPTNNGETQFVNVIAFVPAAVTALLALQDGDSAALSGELTIKVWVDSNGKPRPGLDLIAHAVLSPYHVSRKRQAVREDAKTGEIESCSAP
jgi:single-stranded DNA-binding protein